jgi:aminoglycoside phosphotransferase (APT) family kinase protein
MCTNIHKALKKTYAQEFPEYDSIHINNVNKISNGWETDIYAFDLESGQAGDHTYEELILRIYPGEGGAIESAREFRGMRLLHECGYPVPRVHLQGSEDSIFGYPFVIMERITGQLMRQLMNNAPPEEMRDLQSQFCELFVNLHNLDWHPFVDSHEQVNENDPYQFVDNWINTGKQGIQQFQLQGFSEALDWFAERRNSIPCSQPSVVHLDFHPNNVLLQTDGQAFVIDWSQVSLSDARFDLAWTLVLASAYFGEEWRDQILAGYESYLGERIDRIEVFEAFACTRRLFIIVACLTHGAAALGMRPDTEERMRQQMGPLSTVYNRVHTITGIKIPEVDQILESTLHSNP